VFLVNSRLGHFSAAPSGHQVFHLATLLGAPLLPKLRGHFAEFLDEGSLARLGILSPPTCVGFRYGHLAPFVRGFSRQFGFGQFATFISLPVTPQALRETVFPASHPTGLDALYQPCAAPTLLRHPFLKRLPGGSGISTAYPSPTPPRPRLRPRLTLGGRAFPRNP
jgi:hypothetical protein